MHIQWYDIIPWLRPYVKMICTMDCNGDTDVNQVRVFPDACVNYL